MEHMESLGRILGFDQQMLYSLAFQWFNTLVMAGVLAWLLYKPVKKFMKARTERIKGQLDTAEASMKDANEKKAKYEEHLRNIEAERTEILEAARKRAHERGEEIIAEARAEADLIRSRAELDVQREQERIKDDVKKEMIEISSMIAGRYVASAMDADAANRLIDEAIADMEEVKWLQ